MLQLRRRDERAEPRYSEAVCGLARLFPRPPMRMCDGSRAAAPPSSHLASGGIRSVAEVQQRMCASCERAWAEDTMASRSARSCEPSERPPLSLYQGRERSEVASERETSVGRADPQLEAARRRVRRVFHATSSFFVWRVDVSRQLNKTVSWGKSGLSW